MKRISFILLFFTLLVAHLWLTPQVLQSKKQLDEKSKLSYVMPSSFVRGVALDFKGLVADYTELQAVFFIGEKIERRELITIEDWKYFKRLILLVVDLDPYFYDPYYFAGSMLAWGPHLYDDAIEILKIGMKHRTTDRRLPFMIGFYYYYFMNDVENGAKYISLASHYPDAPPLYKTLAVRLKYYSGDYGAALIFLEETIRNTRDEDLIRMYKKRYNAISRAGFLERAVLRYVDKFGDPPTEINDLIDTEIIDAVPADPYGGTFFIKKDGRVFSTSKFAD